MAEVVLFRPVEFYSKMLRSFRPPLGLVYIGTALERAGFSVEIIDTEVTRDWQGALQRAIGPETIFAGVGVITGFQIRGAIEFSQAVKAQAEVPVVWGGLHPSILPEQTIAHEAVDIISRGEGEESVVALARCLKTGEPLDDVPGLVYMQGGEIRKTADQPDDFIDMNTLATPDYDLIDHEYYAAVPRSYTTGRSRCLDLNSDRGCPSRCGFCYNLNFNRRRWRAQDAEHVLRDIEAVVGKYKLDALNFVADNFCVDPRRVRAICQGIVDRGIDIHWQVDIRIDGFLRFDDELLELMKRAGCVELTFGLESGSPRMLELIHKDITVEQILQAHERAKRFGFDVAYHFMIGFPDDTAEDVRQTLGLIHRLTADRHVIIYGPAIYVPYPGTSLFERSLERGFTPPDNLEGWIRYDFDRDSKFDWFTPDFKRLLREAQFVANSASPQRNLISSLIRPYFRFRLAALARGQNFAGLPFALEKAGKQLFRLARRVWRKIKNPRQ